MSKGQSTKNKTESYGYDIVDDFSTISQFKTEKDDMSQKSSQRPPQAEVKETDVPNNMFFLPESLAFILSNSIECNNGVTNINNNINIFNSSNLDMS